MKPLPPRGPSRSPGFGALFAALALFACVSGCDGCFPPYPPDAPGSGSTETGGVIAHATADGAAAAGLSDLKEIGKKNFKALGFDSLDELASATLGAPAVLYSMGPKGLQSDAPGSPKTLLVEVGRHYPVSAGPKSKSSVTVHAAKGRFVAAILGQPALARRTAAARERFAKLHKIRLEDVSVIRVTGFNVTLVGAELPEQGFMVSPIDDSTELSKDETFSLVKVAAIWRDRAVAMMKDPGPR